jgi:hypothetical protein
VRRLSTIPVETETDDITECPGHSIGVRTDGQQRR